MVATRIRVKYARKIGDSATYSSTTYGIEVEFDIPDDAEWQPAYMANFVVAKTIVDSQIVIGGGTQGDVSAPPATVAAPPPAATPQAAVTEPPAAEAASSEPPDPDVLVSYAAAKIVFDAEDKTDVNKKRYVRVRLDHPDIPGRYRHGKSYEPSVMDALERLRKGDRVNISGNFEKPWTDKDGRPQFALVVTEVERIKADTPAAQ